MGNKPGLDSPIEEEKKEVKEDDALLVSKELSLSHSLLRLVGSEKFADVVFIVGPKQQRIYGHKVIICARSKTMEKMVAEAKPSEASGLPEISLPDIAVGVFMTILKCIYGDTTDINPRTVPEVVTAAQKLQIPALVEGCSKYMEQGVTLQNALAMYQISPDAAQKFIEKNFSDIVHQKDFLLLSADNLKKLLRSDALSIDEVSLFQAVIRWGEENLDKTEHGRHFQDSEAGLQYILKDIVVLIRFPLMSLEDFTTVVVPTGVLTQEQQLDVFQYLATKNTEAKSPTSFSSKLRMGEGMSFIWDKNLKHETLEVRDGGRIICSKNDGWKTILGDKEFSKGVLQFEIVLTKYDKSNMFNVVVGVVPANFPFDNPDNGPNLNALVTCFGYNRMSGWCYITGTAKAFNGGTVGVLRGELCNEGDKIGVRVVINNPNENGSIHYYKNGHSLNCSFHNVRGPVRPALALVRDQEVRLNTNVVFPP